MWLPLKYVYQALTLSADWDISAKAASVTNDNSTARFIFNDLASLLSQWPNTGHPNGHTLVFGEISAHSILYHARKDSSERPPSPEWLAFDPEMSYAVEASRLPWGETYLHTYRTRRHVRVLYFNGMSAAWGEGWIDAQHVVIAGGKSRANATENLDWWDDYGRARKLCQWAEPLGIDGILRMNAGFEVIWCDFESDALQLVSQLNVTPPGTTHDTPRWSPRRDVALAPPPPPHGGRWPHFPEPAPLASSGNMEWARAASTRPFMPQPHVLLDYSQVVTFYHPRLTSLHLQYSLPMAEHKIWEHISDQDAKDILAELTGVLGTKGSGYDWGLAARDMTYYWSSRIQQLDALLSNPAHLSNVTERVQRLTYSPLNPFMEAKDASFSFFHHRGVDGKTAFERCTFQSTSFDVTLGPQERLLRLSIQTVQERLCSDFAIIFEESSKILGASTKTDVENWGSRVRSLVAWLDWPTFWHCEELCGDDSVCSMPMWPLTWAGGRPGGPPPRTAALNPQCISLDPLKRLGFP